MSLIEQHLLTAIVFLPLLGAIILLAFPRGEPTGARGFALGVCLIDLALALWLWARFDTSLAGWQFEESLAWIPAYGIHYSVAIDGLTLALVVLTAFLAPLVILSTYTAVQDYVREYMVCLLFLQTGMLGAFVATDLFLFYVFWEVMLVPMYFLIGIWGGKNRIYATLKFFLYTMSGSLLMLVAIVYTVWAVRDQGGLTFSLAEVHSRLVNHNLGTAEPWLFLAFAIAFAVKVPMFPFHTWLPDAHVEAPTGGSVILAGVLLKLGTFGFLRYALGLFPQTAVAFLPALGLIAVIGIIYGALVSMVQQDLKRLVAYSSVSHLGFVMLGIVAMTATGLSGSVLQMVNHGVSTGALFFLVGVIYERRHTRMIDDFGGLAKVMPRFAAVWVLITLSSIGLPGLNGFVGEFLILLGTFQSQGVELTVATSSMATIAMLAVQAIAATGVVLALIALSRPAVAARFSATTRALGGAAVLVSALLLAAPPVAGFGGGLLVRPLVPSLTTPKAFCEVFAVLAVLAATGVIFAAVYLLWATQRVFFGPIKYAENQRLHDLTARELLVLTPLALVAIWIGVNPQPLLNTISPTVAVYAQQFREHGRLSTADSRGRIRAGDVSHPDAAAPAGFVRPQQFAVPAMPAAPRALPWQRAIEEQTGRPSRSPEMHK